MKKIGKINGYEYFYDPKHPQANKAGIVYVHRAVMYDVLGRVLTKDDVVHHRDGDRSNNDPLNLELTTLSKHTSEHLKERAHPKFKAPCDHCGKMMERTPSKRREQMFCSNKCRSTGMRKTERPSKEKLQELLDTTTWVTIGRLFGVTDNAVRKWARYYGIKKNKKPSVA